MSFEIANIKDVILIPAGIVVTAVGWYKLAQRSDKKTYSKSAKGIIYKNEKEFTTNQSILDFSTVRFLTEDKTWITEKLEEGSTPAMFMPGDEITVKYNPDDPKDFIVLSGKLDTLYTFIIILGILMTVAGLFLYFKK